MSYTIKQYDIVESTNDEAKKLIELGDYADTVIIAKSQTRGRGRHGRRWISPVGNLYMTIIKPPVPKDVVLSQLSLVVGVALYRVLRKLCPPECYLSLKWPNDILINKNKVGGILVETETDKDGGLAQAVGIGLNFDSSPEMVAFPAGCLKDFLPHVPATATVANDIIAEFDKVYKLWIKNGFDSVRTEWLWTAFGLGKPICARVDNGVEVYGRFITLGLDGCMVLTDDEGSEFEVRSSDVSYLT